MRPSTFSDETCRSMVKTSGDRECMSSGGARRQFVRGYILVIYPSCYTFRGCGPETSWFSGPPAALMKSVICVNIRLEVRNIFCIILDVSMILPVNTVDNEKICSVCFSTAQNTPRRANICVVTVS